MRMLTFALAVPLAVTPGAALAQHSPSGAPPRRPPPNPQLTPPGLEGPQRYDQARPRSTVEPAAVETADPDAPDAGAPADPLAPPTTPAAPVPSPHATLVAPPAAPQGMSDTDLAVLAVLAGVVLVPLGIGIWWVVASRQQRGNGETPRGA